MYEDGTLTMLHLQMKLIEAAATTPPADIAPKLSALVLDAIEQRTITPPTSPDDPDGIWIGNWSDDARRNYCEGAWNWNRYFRARTT
jgi:hypothetical protein